MKILPFFFILFWFCLSIYFGTGGYNYINIVQGEHKVEQSKDTVEVLYNNITYKNKAHLNYCLELEANASLYPIISSLPTSLLILITIFSFGILGSVTNLIKQIAIENKPMVELKYISEPILGMLTGFIIIGLSYLVPSTLATTDIELKPMSLVFLSFFSGLFSKDFFIHLSKLFNRIFKT